MTTFRLLILVAGLSGIPLKGLAQLQDYVWVTNAFGAIRITSYIGPGGNVFVPQTITGRPVTEIGQNAFYGRSLVTSVATGDSVVTVGPSAFSNCSGLTNAVVGDGVTSLGTRAFGFCSSLTAVSIGESVSSLGTEAFYYCPSLLAFTVNPTNFWFSSPDGVLFNRTQTLLIQYPAGREGPYAIPETVLGIGAAAFNWCVGLTAINIPDAVTGIGPGAFEACYLLTGITVGSGVGTIGDETFSYCSGLVTVFFLGDAPALGLSVFAEANSATVYYLPGSIGWEGTFGGRPAVLWNPEVSVTGGPFGVGAEGFGFTVTGTAGIPVVVEVATDLLEADWMTLDAFSLTNGSVHFTDSTWTNQPVRFYRLRSP